MESSVEIRSAREDDIPQMVLLSAARRVRYAQAQPVFWNFAPDADEKQSAWLKHLLTRETVRGLIAESGSEVLGFVLAQLVPSPPVYDPGGPTCSIDDYEVRDENSWPDVGRQLLDSALAWAREGGAAQAVVVCGHHDFPKREMLQAAGFPIASEWRVRPLKEPE